MYFVYMKKKHTDVVSKSTHTEVDAGHGRIEQRIYRQLLIKALLNLEWVTKICLIKICVELVFRALARVRARARIVHKLKASSS